MNDLSFNIPGAANTVTNFMGSTFILSIVGAFISDTYISRFHTCLIFGVIEIVVSKHPAQACSKIRSIQQLINNIMYD